MSPVRQWPPRPQWFIFPIDLTAEEWTTHYRLRHRWKEHFTDNILCYERPDCKHCCHERLASAAHITCIKTAFTRIPDLTIAILAQITLMTRPIPSPEWSYVFETISTPNLLQVLPPPSALADTELARFLNQIRSRLPLELHKLIASHLPSGFFRNQAACVALLDHVVPKLQQELPQRDRAPRYPLADCKTIEKLGINTVRIMDETCVSLVGSDNSVVYDEEIHLDSQEVAALQVGFGHYGIVGLRLRYSNRLSSSWLGGIHPKRTVTYVGNDLKRLRTASDVCILT
jgi:hypothetical protein